MKSSDSGVVRSLSQHIYMECLTILLPSSRIHNLSCENFREFFLIRTDRVSRTLKMPLYDHNISQISYSSKA